jgi:predicted anti-sigma-YlaC factor YlaD
MKKELNKMDCMPYRDKIDDYLEGRLGEAEISFLNHLQECPDCRQLIQIQKIADRIIIQEKSYTPAKDLTAKVMARIGDAKVKEDTALIRYLRPVAITISVAAAIFAGVMLGIISEKHTRTSTPVELSLINDIDIENLNSFSTE